MEAGQESIAGVTLTFGGMAQEGPAAEPGTTTALHMREGVTHTKPERLPQGRPCETADEFNSIQILPQIGMCVRSGGLNLSKMHSC